LLDLDYSEDKDAEVDLNLVMTGAGQFIEVQGTGEEATFSRSQLDRLLKLGKVGIDAITIAQRRAQGLFKLRQAENSESLGKAISHAAHGGREAWRHHVAQDVDDAVTQRRHHLRRPTLAYAAGILSHGHVTSVVQPVLDGPVPPCQFQQPPRIRALRTQAGDPVDDLHGRRPLLGAFTHDRESLLQARPVLLLRQDRGRP
jgi:3' exoribonuclease family, domain 2